MRDLAKCIHRTPRQKSDHCLECDLIAIERAALSVDRSLPKTFLQNTIRKYVRGVESSKRLSIFLQLHPATFTGSPGCPPRLRPIIRDLSRQSSTIKHSRCTSCAKVLKMDCSHERSSGFICSACDAVDRGTMCSGCLKVKPISATKIPGGPLCDWCRLNHVSRQRICDSCGETTIIRSVHGGKHLCSRCYKPPKTACAQCGRVRSVATRLDERGSVCGTCYRRPLRLCGQCGQNAPIHKSDPNLGDICTKCYRAPKRKCSSCERTERCYKLDGSDYLCRNCGSQTKTCAYCGQPSRRIEASWPEGPCCFTCYRSAWSSPAPCVLCEEVHAIVTRSGLCWKCAGVRVHGKVCQSCKTEGLLWNAGQCSRCYVTELSDAYLTGPDGVIKEAYHPVRDILVSAVEPQNAIRWLSQSTAAAKIGKIIKSGRSLSLDDFYDPSIGRQMSFALDLFLSAGAISRDDDDLRELMHWLDMKLLKTRSPSSLGIAIVKQFAHWAVFRSFKRAIRGGRSREQATKFAKHILHGALDFLKWLEQRGVALKDCQQNDVEVYFSQQRKTVRDAASFLRWSPRRHLMRSMQLPIADTGEPNIAVEDERFTTISRLFTDLSLPLQVRAVGLLVAFYGQIPGRLRRLRKSDVQRSERNGVVTIVGGRRQPLELEPIIGEIVWQLRSTSGVHAGIASGVGNEWLFEGYRPGRALSESGLGRQLAKAGINVRALRGAALVDMASNVELQIISSEIDLTDQTAYRWWELAGGSWGGYAADRAKEASEYG
jgi:hypothetical protein